MAEDSETLQTAAATVPGHSLRPPIPASSLPLPPQTDPTGNQVDSHARLPKPHNTVGLAERQLFASQFSSRRWRIEEAGNHLIATFVKGLLEHGKQSTRYAQASRSIPVATGPEKNDVVDATNVARALLANPQWP